MYTMYSTHIFNGLLENRITLERS